uniref:Uncharacterized protein n=1 Tax=Rhizophora mucronata TaxID=61149 RepID=A0A2P2ITX9_RHIMU
MSRKQSTQKFKCVRLKNRSFIKL